MLTRLLIENYRCFEQAVIEPGSLALLVGPNGTGKSTVFDALWNIRQLVTTGGSASELFPESTRMRWGRETRQRFELGFRGPDGDYTYRLVIHHGKGAQPGQIELEEILHEQEPLYSFFREEVTIHAHEKSRAQRFPAGNKLSPLSNLPLQVRSKRLDWVTDRIFRIWVFRPVPPKLEPFTSLRSDFLEPDLSNFASWLLAMQKVRPSLRRTLKQSLRIVLDGFLNYQFVPLGRETNVLVFMFSSPRPRSEPIAFFFNELSEGQRALVVLYTLLHAIPSDATLCIDEPEEFLSPREIHPWLNRLMDVTEDGGQALLISHNPGLIDLLAPSNGILLARPRGGPVQIKRVPRDESGLAISELLARGWLE
ncbi:AAA family ATPase [Archangium sp.]|uniref:AAA family ATPase n=1 Tax=Archangium sp. TaxID=1872627 RepID=UPI002D596DBE|nr:AAA family ATPase [Archangium sp.]HYO52688.1 AAA family ATPase [Archangium sp.]